MRAFVVIAVIATALVTGLAPAAIGANGPTPPGSEPPNVTFELTPAPAPAVLAQPAFTG